VQRGDGGKREKGSGQWSLNVTSTQEQRLKGSRSSDHRQDALRKGGPSKRTYLWFKLPGQAKLNTLGKGEWGRFEKTAVDSGRRRRAEGVVRRTGELGGPEEKPRAIGGTSLMRKAIKGVKIGTPADLRSPPRRPNNFAVPGISAEEGV